MNPIGWTWTIGLSVLLVAALWQRHGALKDEAWMPAHHRSGAPGWTVFAIVLVLAIMVAISVGFHPCGTTHNTQENWRAEQDR